MTAVLGAEVRKARKVADAVARARDLTIRELHEPTEHRDAERLLGRVWRTGPASPPVSGDLMRALSHAGAYVAGAFLDGELVGVTAAFLANRPGSSAELHSHITGVVSEVRGHQVGWALKLHQRAWSLERGIESIAWTFDPLVRRNAYFNLTKLGAHVVSYLVDFYGEMADGVNAGQGSDRLLVRWPLRAPDVIAAAAGHHSETPAAEGATILDTDGDGRPRRLAMPDGPTIRCAVPADIEGMRLDDPALAQVWRMEVRAAFEEVLASGARVAGVTKDGWYVFTRERENR